MNRANLKGLSLTEMEDFVLSLGEKKYKARQLFQWIYQKGETAFEKMTNLAKPFRGKLEERAYVSALKLVKKQKSRIDQTEKFLFELEDRETVEAVLMREKNRITVCVSTQAGCALNCSFCATGKLGFKRDLTSGEIVDQLIYLRKYLSSNEKNENITNVVLMGMGEPLLNFENVVKSIRIMNSELGLGISARKITLSTVGIIPQIEKLLQENLKIKLALSLNSPFEEKRTKLMPINKKYPLKKLLPVVKKYALKADNRITFEYILIKGINDSLKDAEKLSQIIQGIPCKINLIPYNRVRGLAFEPPDEQAIKKFQEYLYPRSPAVTLRKSKGQDIQAACGQLKGECCGG
jgi:23S rRNA (adenine2503-C2)-methyltransferase